MNVIPLPQRRSAPQPPQDALTAARELIAEYEAASARERNYGSSRFADLMFRALRDLAVSCAPLREEHKRDMAEVLRRADYGDGPARALSAQERHLRVVK